MPPGPRKRKAARKKKEKENNINPSTNSPKGNERDEKGSSGGEGNSPAFHEHGDHHNPFNDGSEDLEERGTLVAQPRASDVETLEEVPSDVKIGQVLGGKKDSDVLVERGLKSQDCSDSRDVSFEHVEIAKVSCYENGNCNSVEEAIANHELVKPIDSSPSKMPPVEETVNSAPDSSLNSVKTISFVSEVENSDSGGGRVLVKKSVMHPVEVINLAMKINHDNVYPLNNENVTKSNLEEPKPNECDSKILTSLSASPFTKFTNGAEHIADCETAKHSENQPHVALAPNVVQKTSWLSCCGLFELLSSSNR